MERKAGPGRTSAYLLGFILTCECGSNFVAYDSRDYVYGAVRDGACSAKHKVRFRRDEVNGQFFE
jgi:hypothetical protein